MIRLKDFEGLPDALDQGAIEDKVKFLLSSYSDGEENLVLECLYELAVRQANNFSLLSCGARESINKFVGANWDESSLDNTDLCLGIIVNLGLQPMYEYMISRIPNIDNCDVVSAINDCISDLGNDVSDVSLR